MLLQSLDDLYERLRGEPDYKLPIPGHSLQKVFFKVVLRPTGRIHGLANLTSASTQRPAQLLVPGGPKPSGGVTPKSAINKVQLLRSDVRYLLGAIRASDDESRLVAEKDPFCFEAFRDYHLEHEEEIGDPKFSVVCRFLEAWQPEEVAEYPGWAELAAGQGVFQIQGDAEYVHERPGVRRWWSNRESDAGDEFKGQCLVTGDYVWLARLHPKVKGVKGAQVAGATIAGFNDDAYCSYGKKQSYNAPVGQGAAFRYTASLNSLLDGPMRRRHTQLLGDMTIAFWTDRPSVAEDIFARFLERGSEVAESDDAQDEGTRLKVESFLRAIREGRQAYATLVDDPNETRFFLLAMSPNASRIAVRFFHCSSLGELLDNLRRHYEDSAVTPEPARGRRPADPAIPATWQLLRESGRERKDIPPLLAAPLLEAVIRGKPYPAGLYQAVIRRIQADRVVNYMRAYTIRGYLTRNQGKEMPMSLDPDRPEPAYRLGRLFAALEKTQRDALGEGLSATLRDSFYSSASATPGAVFPRLLRTYQHHLAKLEGGRRVNRERLVQEILDPLETFPGHFDLGAQGQFALGYYQQMRDFYRKREDASTQA